VAGLPEPAAGQGCWVQTLERPNRSSGTASLDSSDQSEPQDQLRSGHGKHRV
jgi:hypothetical protein